MTEEERQAHVARFLKRWKEEKQETEAEAKAFAATAEYKEILKQLKERNAARGITIPGV